MQKYCWPSYVKIFDNNMIYTVHTVLNVIECYVIPLLCLNYSIFHLTQFWCCLPILLQFTYSSITLFYCFFILQLWWMLFYSQRFHAHEKNLLLSTLRHVIRSCHTQFFSINNDTPVLFLLLNEVFKKLKKITDFFVANEVFLIFQKIKTSEQILNWNRIDDCFLW